MHVNVQPSVANATNIDTLLANKEGIECVKVPPENLQDKVFFIFNNLSMSNMDTKVTSLVDFQFSMQHFSVEIEVCVSCGVMCIFSYLSFDMLSVKIVGLLEFNSFSKFL